MTLRTALLTQLKRPWAAFFQTRTGRVARGAWAELVPRRVFILPTRAGLGFAGLLLVMLLGAINYNNNLIFGFTFLLTGLALVTMLHTYRNLTYLQLHVGHGRPGFAGENVGFQIWLRPGDDRYRYNVELRASDSHSTDLVDITAEGSSTWLYRDAPRRGRLTLGAVTVTTCFPLGLFRAWSRLEFANSELVYPAPAATGPQPPAPADQGKGHASLEAGQDDFRGLRNYHPGDSLRHVHWKALAREQGLLTKEFAAPHAPECWFDFQATPENEVEAKLRRLCRWVLDAERARLRYGLRLPGLSIDPARGVAHRNHCLAVLAEYGAAP